MLVFIIYVLNLIYGHLYKGIVERSAIACVPQSALGDLETVPHRVNRS